MTKLSLSEVTVVWSWGENKDLPAVQVAEGDHATIYTDNEQPFALAHVALIDNVLVIRPACLMIRATAEMLDHALASIQAGPPTRPRAPL